MDEEFVLHGKDGVSHLQEEVGEEVKEEDQGEATPAGDGLNSSDEEVSEENPQGEDKKQPEHEDENIEQLQGEERKSGGTDALDHPLAQETSQIKSTPEKKAEDVCKETHRKEKEPTKPFKEHDGEGDGPHIDKEDTREPSVTAQDTSDSNVRDETDYQKVPNKQRGHRGEGDAPYIYKEDARKPSVTAQDTSDSKFPINYVIAAVVVALLAYWLLRARPPPAQKPFDLVEVFRQEMDMVESSFPSQRKELWRRSRIHLLRHLNMSQPSEPVSLILTSGRGAEKTLGCLAQQLAAAFSTARNASALDIDGTSKTTEDSDQVKLDIDKALREAFDGGKQAVVVHRFEELPPGSTLIFYRYCDHENAAYKNVFLAFTVLLEEELEPSPNLSLGMVEEMVQEYLKEKFISSDRTAVFNQMDVDKLSGLWSRISHLILPVSAEERIEQHGCGGPK